MRLVTAVLAGSFILPTQAAGSPQNVAVERVAGVSVAGRQLYSSSQLRVAWTAGSDPLHHFEISAREGVQATRVRISAAASATSATLTGLKSQTTYAVMVIACANESCSQSSSSAEVEVETDREHWQLQGSGNSVTRLTTIVSDGNARLSATRFGSDAGAMANRVQLYYGPLSPVGARQSTLSVGVASSEATAADASTYLSFTSRAGSSGLHSPSPAAALVSTVSTGQGVPVSRERGGFVRLFFEATGTDNKTRVFSIDSKDGFYGLDFNSGAPGICSTAAEYASGGGCEPVLAIGVDGDANGNSRITNARQQKVGWPTLDSPHWDLSAGTFMVFTTDRVTGCSSHSMNHGYAVWTGTAWVVQYQSNGCPTLFTSAQAAFPFHSGGAKYRLYYGDPSLTDGKVTNSQLPFLGPKKLIYADGSVSGQAGVVDFEDWESQTSARDVVYLWPNGDQLDARAEGYIDDYHFLTPTGSMDLQVMYITITDGSVAPIAVAAVLLNP